MTYSEERHQALSADFSNKDHRLSVLAGKRERGEADFDADEYRVAHFDRVEALQALSEEVAKIPSP